MNELEKAQKLAALYPHETVHPRIGELVPRPVAITTYDPESGVLQVQYNDALLGDFVSVGRMIDIFVRLTHGFDRETAGQYVAELLDAPHLDEHPGHTPLEP